MTKPNRDTVLAILLLLGCGVLMIASFEIREPDYGQLSPAVWPRTIVTALAILSLIYLVQSIRRGPDSTSEPGDSKAPKSPGITNVTAFLAYWRNVIFSFSLFAIYLLVLPWVGMLVGGTLFVFILLNALGGWSPRQLLLHAAIALISVGGMWSLFTYGLDVILPSGELFN